MQHRWRGVHHPSRATAFQIIDRLPDVARRNIGAHVESVGQMFGVEVANVDARRVVARARQAVRQVVDGAVVAPDEDAVRAVRVLPDPAGDLSSARILQRTLGDESAHESVACPENHREQCEEGESTLAPCAETTPTFEERERRRRTQHGQQGKELQEVMLVEPAAERDGDPGESEREHERPAHRIRHRRTRSPDREPPLERRRRERADEDSLEQPRPDRADGVAGISEVAPDVPLEKFTQVTEREVHPGDRDPGQSESTHERADPQSIVRTPAQPLPDHRDRERDQQDSRLVLEERRRRDKHARERRIAQRPRSLRAHEPQKRCRSGQVHHRFGVDRRDAATGSERVQPRGHSSHVVTARPLARGATREERGAKDPGQCDELHHPLAVPDDRRGQVEQERKDGLLLDEPDVRQRAVSEQPAGDRPIGLVDVEDAEEQRGEPRDCQRDKQPAERQLAHPLQGQRSGRWFEMKGRSLGRQDASEL